MACFSPSRPVDPDRIIADAGIDVGARRGHEGEPAAEAIADRADLAALAEPGAGGADRRLDVADALVLVEAVHQVERLLELGPDVGIELDSGLEPPEQVGREREIAVLRPVVALAPDALVDPEYLLDDDDRRRAASRPARRHRRSKLPSPSSVVDRGSLPIRPLLLVVGARVFYST